MIAAIFAAIEGVETATRWLYCNTVFAWWIRWQLEREWRKRDGMTQSAIADELEVSPSTIRRDIKALNGHINGRGDAQ